MHLHLSFPKESTFNFFYKQKNSTSWLSKVQEGSTKFIKKGRYCRISYCREILMEKVQKKRTEVISEYRRAVREKTRAGLLYLIQASKEKNQKQGRQGKKEENNDSQQAVPSLRPLL